MGEAMYSDTVNKMWAVSLIVIGIATVLMTGAQIVGHATGQTPDILVRLCGAADLIALPFLGFASVKKLQNRK